MGCGYESVGNALDSKHEGKSSDFQKLNKAEISTVHI